MLSLAGKTALVTGAGTRVGRAIAETLSARGMQLGLHFNRSRKGAEEVLGNHLDAGGRAELFQANLGVSAEARGLVDRVVTAFGGLDLLVCSAASFERVPYEELDDEAWDRSLNLNSKAQFALAHQSSSALRQSRGSIVFITCASTTVPMRNYLPYVVSKAATKQLMRVLSLELAPDVRVNAVAPGTVLPPDDMDPEVTQRLVGRVPLSRVGEASDVAEAVAYLASAPFVTGQELIVDGGRTVAGFERFG
jgi:pteridine reductase